VGSTAAAAAMGTTHSPVNTMGSIAALTFGEGWAALAARAGMIMMEISREPTGVFGRVANSSLARIWSQASLSMSNTMQTARVW
jgi:hypothetical protein